MMERIFITVLNLALISTFFTLAILLVRTVFKKAPKWICCALWGLLALRLLIPFTPEASFGVIPNSEPVPQNLAEMETPAIDTGFAAVNSLFNPLLQSQNPVLPPSDRESTPSPSPAVTAPDQEAPAESAKTGGIGKGMKILSVIWLCGAAGMLAYAGISTLLIRRKMREAVPEKEGVFRCDGAFSPFILGVFRPRIYLPSALGEKEKGYVLAHERAHLQRKDHLWKPLGFLILSVYWFHPLLWIAYVLLCRDIEYACDEKVIRALGEEAKKPYSEALLSCSVSRRALAACPVAFGETSVKGRIKNVLNYKKPSFWILLVALLACIALCVFFFTRKKAEDPPAEEPSGEENTSAETVDFAEVLRNIAQEDYGLIGQGAMIYRSVLQKNALVLAIAPQSRFYLFQNNGVLLVSGTCGSGENGKGEFVYTFREGEPTDSRALSRMVLHLDLETSLLHFDPADGVGLVDGKGEAILTEEEYFTPFSLHNMPPRYEGVYGVASFDINGDGITEHWSLDPGGTSGVFSLRIGTFTYQTPRHVAFLSPVEFFDPCFLIKDDRLYVADKKSGETRYLFRCDTDNVIQVFDCKKNHYLDPMVKVPLYLKGQSIEGIFQSTSQFALNFDNYTVSVYWDGKDALPLEERVPTIQFQRKTERFYLSLGAPTYAVTQGKYLFDPETARVALTPDSPPSGADKVVPYVFRLNGDTLVAVSGPGLTEGEVFSVGYRADLTDSVKARKATDTMEYAGVTYLLYDKMVGDETYALLAVKDGRYVGESVFYDDDETGGLHLALESGFPVLAAPSGRTVYRLALNQDDILLVNDRLGSDATRLTSFRCMPYPLSTLLTPDVS